MSDKSDRVTLTIPFSQEEIEAIDSWIERHEEPRPTREEAVRRLIVGRLGAEGPHSIMPKLVTGRDIV